MVFPIPMEIQPRTQALLTEAEKLYWDNFDGRTWYGRCIFLSWYCSLGDCTFCYRTTQKHKIKHPPNSRRSRASVLLEALFARLFGWRIEFLTGGYGIQSLDEFRETVKQVQAVYGDKLWLNLGVLAPQQIEGVKDHVEGIVASVETVNPKIHDYVCPSKPLLPYERMLDKLDGMKRSACVIIGLGEDEEDMEYLFDWIEKRNLDRLTVYALKPVTGLLGQT